MRPDLSWTQLNCVGRLSSVLLALVLIAAPPLSAQEELSGQGESEGLEDVEALELLELEMLRDIGIGTIGIGTTGLDMSEGPYDAVDESPNTVGVSTVVEVPRSCPIDGSYHQQQPYRRNQESHLDLPSGSDDEILDDLELSSPPTVLTHFDLSTVEPLFGIEELDREPIQAFLNFLTTDGRRRLTRLLARSGRYSELIRTSLREAGLPEELLYLVMVESGFNPSAISRVGAQGLWQFMPRTGRGQGLEVGRRYDERRDPELATVAAIDYLQRLYDRFGSWPLAMSGYNAGGGYVRGQLVQHNINDFWVADSYGAIYNDTRRYVYRIIASAIIGENPELFGFEGVVREDPVQHETVEVPGETRLLRFARACDVDVDELMELNPALLVSRTPETESYELHIPVGTRADFIEEYDDFSFEEGDPHYIHRVRFGETIEHLHQIFGVQERIIRHSNGLGRNQSVEYGAELVIPLDPEEAEAALASDGSSSGGGEPPVIITPELIFDYPERLLVFYEVQTGDQLYDIADALGVSPFELGTWNDVDPTAELHAGMTLQLFLDPDMELPRVRLLMSDEVRVIALGSSEYEEWVEAASQRRRASRRRYTVRRGDTLSTIARRFGCTSRDLIRWNNIDNPNSIRAGTELRVR